MCNKSVFRSFSSVIICETRHVADKMSEFESNEPSSSKCETALYCRVCDVNLSDASVLESHYTGKKHAKKMR